MITLQPVDELQCCQTCNDRVQRCKGLCQGWPQGGARQGPVEKGRGKKMLTVCQGTSPMTHCAVAK